MATVSHYFTEEIVERLRASRPDDYNESADMRELAMRRIREFESGAEGPWPYPRG